MLRWLVRLPGRRRAGIPSQRLDVADLVRCVPIVGCLLLTLTAAAAGQSLGRITGVVRTTVDAGAGARVVIRGNLGSVTVADSTGHFVLPSVEPGTHMLVATLEGWNAGKCPRECSWRRHSRRTHHTWHHSAAPRDLRHRSARPVLLRGQRDRRNEVSCAPAGPSAGYCGGDAGGDRRPAHYHAHATHQQRQRRDRTCAVRPERRELPLSRRSVQWFQQHLARWLQGPRLRYAHRHVERRAGGVSQGPGVRSIRCGWFARWPGQFHIQATAAATSRRPDAECR